MENPNAQADVEITVENGTPAPTDTTVTQKPVIEATVEQLPPENMRVENPQPVAKKRTGLIPKLASGALALAAVLATFSSRTNSSKIRKIAEDGLLDANAGNNTIETIENLYNTATQNFPEANFDGALRNAQKGADKVRKGFGYKLIAPIFNSAKNATKNFAKQANKTNTNPSEPKGWGIINGGLVALAGLIGGTIKLGSKAGKFGIEATRQAALDIGNTRGDRKDAKAFAKLDKVADKFSVDTYKAAAKSGSFINKDGDTEKLKLGFGEHAKNGIIALGVGAVVYGGTMLVSKFIEKRQEAARAKETQVAMLEFENEKAVLNTQTQMSK